jgi:hypothetical protein
MSGAFYEDVSQQRGPIRELRIKLPYGSPLLGTSLLRALLIEDDTVRDRG